MFGERVFLLLVNFLLSIPRAIILKEPGALLGATTGIMYTFRQPHTLRECF
jgi:hypothetical protein